MTKPCAQAAKSRDPVGIARLDPSNGVPTKASHLLDGEHGALLPEGALQYHRVAGSRTGSIAPQIYGANGDYAIVNVPEGRHQPEVSYTAEYAVEHREFTVSKHETAIVKEWRKDFQRSGFAAYYRNNGPLSWDLVSDRYPKAKFIMWMAQINTQMMRDAGFPEGIIETAKHGKLDGYETAGKRFSFEIHHCVPLALGGSNEFSNFVIAEAEVHRAFFHTGDARKMEQVVGNGRDKYNVALVVPKPGVLILKTGYNVKTRTFRRGEGLFEHV